MTIKMEVLESIKNDIDVQDRARAPDIHFPVNCQVDFIVYFQAIRPRFSKDLLEHSLGCLNILLWVFSKISED